MNTKPEFQEAVAVDETVNPVEVESAGIAAAAAQVRADAKTSPEAYLKETESPGGGE